MNKKKKWHIILYTIVVLFVVVAMIAGCRGQERPKPTPQEKDKEKIPPAVTSMDESIHSIIEGIEGIEDATDIKPEDIKPEEEGGGGQGGQGGEGGQQPEPQGEQPAMSQQIIPEDEQKKIQREKEAEVLEKWQTAEEDLTSLHESWNEYEGTAVKDGGDPSKVNEMESALNNLTTFIMQKNEDGVLNEANNVILGLSNFMDLYKGNVDGVLGKMEYNARQSYMDAKAGAWTEAAEKMQENDSLETTLRQRADIEEDQKPLVEKLTLSLEDLEKSITEENLDLVKIKRDIVIKNLETLKDELK